MFFEIAGAAGANGPPGRTAPSITGLKPCLRRLANDMALIRASTAFWAANKSLGGRGDQVRDRRRRRASFIIWRAVSVAVAASMVSTDGPLCTIALWNRPCADGIAINMQDLAPPPDSPKMVTFSGSPPNFDDIVAHPFERRDDVEHAGIARLRVVGAADLREMQIPERAEPVVQRHHHDIALARRDWRRRYQAGRRSRK